MRNFFKKIQSVIIYALVVIALSSCATSGSFKTAKGEDATNLWEYDEIASKKGYRRWRDTTHYGHRFVGWNKFMALPFYAVFDENDKLVEYIGTAGAHVVAKEYSSIRQARRNYEAEQKERSKLERDELTNELVELRKKEKENSKVVICPNAEDCKKVFSLTQIFISQNAGMKIQLATDAIIETYGSKTELVMKATKTPDIGKKEIIDLKVICPVDNSGYVNAILESEVTCKKLEIGKFNSYLSYIKDKVPSVTIR